MAEARANNSRESSRRQGGRYVAAPRDVVQLLDLEEIEERFGIGVARIYRAVARGELRAYGRPGRQKYYSETELIQAFGEVDPNGGPGGSRKMERTAKGGYLRQLELDVDVAA